MTAPGDVIEPPKVGGGGVQTLGSWVKPINSEKKREIRAYRLGGSRLTWERRSSLSRGAAATLHRH